MITITQVQALHPCAEYSADRLTKLIPPGGLAYADALEPILALPYADARWLLARLLQVGARIEWAKAGSERAYGYAYEARKSFEAARASVYMGADERSAYYASNFSEKASRFTRESEYSANNAYMVDEAANANLASCRAADASAYAACHATAHVYTEARYDAEHRIACEHALNLLATLK